MSSNNEGNRMSSNKDVTDRGNNGVKRERVPNEEEIGVVGQRRNNNHNYNHTFSPQLQYRPGTIVQSQSLDDFIGNDNNISNHLYGVGPTSPTNIGMIGHDLSADDIQDLFGSIHGADANEDNSYRGCDSFSLSDNFHHQQHQNSVRSSSGIQDTYFPGMNEQQRVVVASGSNSSSTLLRNTMNNQVGMTHSVEHGGGYDRQGSMASANDPSDGNQSDGCGRGGDDLGYDDKLVSRTERKRSREKQRRFDVNKQFNDLTACLRHVESEYDSSELRAASLPAVFSASNRADLLARTVALLHALNDTNKRRKKEILDLKSQLDVSKQTGEDMAQKLKESIMAPQSVGGNKVMVMVPMMLGNDGTQHAMMYQNAATNPMWGMNQMHQQQHHPHQAIPAPTFPFMMPSPAGFLNSNSAAANTAAASSSVQQQQSHAASMNAVAPASATSSTAIGANDSNGVSTSGVDVTANNNIGMAASAISQNNQQQMLQQQAMMTQVPHWGMIQQQQHHAMQQMPFMMMPPQQHQFMPQMIMPVTGSTDGSGTAAIASTSGPINGVASSSSASAASIGGISVQQQQQQQQQQPVVNSNTSSPTSSHNSGKTDRSDPNLIGSNLAHCA
jgi:hypothetical protein